MSKLYFRYGAMNSGKSTILLQVAHNYQERGMKVAIIKPGVDTKGGSKIVSRLGAEKEVNYVISEIDDIPLVEDISCILVDEAQFLTKKQVEQLYEITKINNIPVICYGLRTDFKTVGFPGSTRLLELADTIEELKTVCKCGNKATFNARRVNGVFVFEGEQVEIDNQRDIEYEPLCGKCYIEEKKVLTLSR